MCFIFRNNKNLRQVREKLKDLSPTGDSEKELKDKLQKLQKKVRNLNHLSSFQQELFARTNCWLLCFLFSENCLNQREESSASCLVHSSQLPIKMHIFIYLAINSYF